MKLRRAPIVLFLWACVVVFIVCMIEALIEYNQGNYPNAIRCSLGALFVSVVGTLFSSMLFWLEKHLMKWLDIKEEDGNQ